MLNARATQACLPNLLIIGSRKAGTTSLHKYLSLHPQINMSLEKELSFFDDTSIRWKRGVEWYKSNFDKSYLINGESSPQYSRHPKIQGVPERIRNILGADIKIIYMVRDPIDRILSDYVEIAKWAATVKWSPPVLPFGQTVSSIENHPEFYIEGSSYFYQISQYLCHFSEDQILIVLQERLGRDRTNTLKTIFKFLGVDETFYSNQFDERLNEGTTKRFRGEWFTRTVPDALQREMAEPTWLPSPAINFLERIALIGGPPINKPILKEADDLYLQEILKKDVMSLRSFLGDPLPEWRSYS